MCRLTPCGTIRNYRTYRAMRCGVADSRRQKTPFHREGMAQNATAAGMPRDPCGVGPLQIGWSRLCRLWVIFFVDGKREGKCRPAAQFAFHRNRPAVLRNDSMHDRQSQPSALPDLLRSEKGIEHLGKNVLRDAVTRVGDGQAEMPVLPGEG